MSRVLLWGAISSTWTESFIDRYLRKYDHEVWVLETGVTDHYKERYCALGVHFIECPAKVHDWYEKQKNGGPIKALFMHFLQIRAVLKEKSFDVIHFHFVDHISLPIVVYLKRKLRAKLILSYWGSDLLRVSRKILSFEGRFVRSADYITFDNEDLSTAFHQTYRWADCVPNQTVLFGLPVLDLIRCRRDTERKNAFCRETGIDSAKKIIAIGYNGIPEQQHIEVLKEISKLNEGIKAGIFLLLQMTYGGTDDYIREVVHEAERTGCRYLILRDYLTDEEVADLRTAVDIYINAQTTDAFSGSVCEYLYADTILINAKWLRYREFEKHGFQYLEFKEFHELPGLIRKGLNDSYDLHKNADLIWDLRAWESCAPRWDQVYRSIG